MTKMLERINYGEQIKLERLLDSLEGNCNVTTNTNTYISIYRYDVSKLGYIRDKVVEENKDIESATRFSMYNVFKSNISNGKGNDIDKMWIMWLKFNNGNVAPSILIEKDVSGVEKLELLAIDTDGELSAVWNGDDNDTKGSMVNDTVANLMGEESYVNNRNFDTFTDEPMHRNPIKVMNSVYMKHEGTDEKTMYSTSNARLDVCSNSYLKDGENVICHNGKYIIVPQPTYDNVEKGTFDYNTRTVKNMFEVKESTVNLFYSMNVTIDTFKKNSVELLDVYSQIIREMENINSTFMVKAKHFMEITDRVNVPILNYLGFIMLAKEYEAVLLKRGLKIKAINDDYLSKLDRLIINHINTALFLGKTNLRLNTNRSFATAYCRYANILYNIVDGYVTPEDIVLEEHREDNRDITELILERDNLLMLTESSDELLNINNKPILESISDIAMSYMDSKDPNVKAKINFILENEYLVINRNKDIDETYLEGIYNIDEIINDDIYLEGAIGNFGKKISKLVGKGAGKLKDSVIDLIASRGGKIKEAFADLENEKDASIRDDAINNKLFPQLDKMINMLQAIGVGAGVYILLGPIFASIAVMAVYIIKNNRTEKNYKRALRMFEDEETIIDKKIELATMKNDDKAIIALMRAKQKIARVRKRTEIEMKEADIHVHVDSDI